MKYATPLAVAAAGGYEGIKMIKLKKLADSYL
jgi:hypothetical protein